MGCNGKKSGIIYLNSIGVFSLNSNNNKNNNCTVLHTSRISCETKRFHDNIQTFEGRRKPDIPEKTCESEHGLENTLHELRELNPRLIGARRGDQPLHHPLSPRRYQDSNTISNSINLPAFVLFPFLSLFSSLVVLTSGYDGTRTGQFWSVTLGQCLTHPAG